MRDDPIARHVTAQEIHTRLGAGPASAQRLQDAAAAGDGVRPLVLAELRLAVGLGELDQDVVGLGAVGGWRLFSVGSVSRLECCSVGGQLDGDGWYLQRALHTGAASCQLELRKKGETKALGDPSAPPRRSPSCRPRS